MGWLAAAGFVLIATGVFGGAGPVVAAVGAVIVVAVKTRLVVQTTPARGEHR